MQRVVITGLGVVSPIGTGRNEFWSNLTAGTPGAGPITLFDAADFPVRIAAEVSDFDGLSVEGSFEAAETIRDRKVLFALASAQQAILDARISDAELHSAMLHIGVGLEVFWLTDLTPYAHASDMTNAIARSLVVDNPKCLLQTPLDTSCTILGDRYGFTAGRFTNCSACAAGAQVIGQAFKMLQDGRAAIALAGAADSMLNPLGLGGFSLLKVLSDENDSPEKACRPFDATRKGTVLGEGAAFAVMETLDHALSRKADIYAEVLGYGSSMDAFRVSDPDPTGRGAVASMNKALENAGLDRRDIDCVSAHGTGTPKNDVVETMAIKEVLGKRAYDIPVHAVKSMTGHMIAASGAVEAVAAALTIAHNKVPPTINLERGDAECDLDYVPHNARRFEGDTVLSNSFGFGGQNATLIFGRYA